MDESTNGSLAGKTVFYALTMTPWSCLTAGWPLKRSLKTAARSGNSATSSRLTTTVMRNDTVDASRKALLPLLISGNVLIYGHRLIPRFTVSAIAYVAAVKKLLGKAWKVVEIIRLV